MATHDEDIKRVRIMPDIDALAAAGYEKIPKDDFTRLKFVGLYKQKQVPYFMIRIKISGGRLTLDQLAECSRIAMEMGSAVDHLSTRQDIELHNITIQSAPMLLKRLAAVGLTCKGACGDTVRNICGVPCADVCQHEVYNVEALRKYLYDHFLADDTVLNLPRKFKISLSGCTQHLGQYQINDIGIFPSKNAERIAKEGPGFEFWVGGGLGAQPLLAQRLSDYIPAAEIPAACAATVETHRLYGNRDSRTNARLKFVLKKWGLEKYKKIWQEHFEDYLAKMGRVELPVKAQETEQWESTLPTTFYQQKKKGFYGVEAMVPLGDARAEDVLSLVGFCRKNNCEVRITQGQNLHILHLTEQAAKDLQPLVEYYGWRLQNPDNAPNVVACVGMDQCGKAVWYTKATAKILTNIFNEEARALPKGLTVHFSGCPNNCGQNSSAAIGFMGAQKPGGWQKVGVYMLYLGGTFQGAGVAGKMVAAGINPDAVPRLVKGLVNAYYEDKKITPEQAQNEDFSTWARTLAKDKLVKILKESDAQFPTGAGSGSSNAAAAAGQ